VLDTFGLCRPIRSVRLHAQDLTLRHCVSDYRQAERCNSPPGYRRDHFINYGFVTRSLHALMHPREGVTPRSKKNHERAQMLLQFVGTGRRPSA
jgi:hypothetical protein